MKEKDWRKHAEDYIWGRKNVSMTGTRFLDNEMNAQYNMFIKLVEKADVNMFIAAQIVKEGHVELDYS